jgi:uncharacterized protein (DUF2235 family)
MKRLVFCFDGTWNRLDAKYSTNVVLTAESVIPISHDGIAQLIFYDEGWPAPGSEDTELGVLMELEVGHGETEVYPRVQA